MAIEVGEAYLQIKPSTDGLTSDIEAAMGDAGSKSSSSFGSSFISGIKKVGAVSAAAVGAAAAGVTALTKSAVSGFADYEQLVGGVETLFGDSADIVAQNASDAFMTAGLSANDYMETVTSFSASLLQSLGGDTAEAASVADMAIRDMSDNANKMGTDMQSIQNAYQGFAKQNYTMLDNLKLGYGGTQAEMQRLLEDATALTGIEYDISSLSDVYTAINVIQTELGITGTTAEEASTTITGSLASVSSAWSNLLVGFVNGDADLGALIDNLVMTVSTAADNMIPAISQALVGIGDFIVQLAPVIAEKLPELLDAVLPALIEATLALVTALAEALPEIIQVLIAYLPQILDLVVDTILSMLPLIVELGLDLILALANGLIEALPDLIPAIVEVVLTIVDKLTEPDTLLQLIGAALQLIVALAEGLIQALPKLLEKAPIIIMNLLQALIQAAPMLLEAAVSLLKTIGNGILNGLATVAQWGADIVQTIKDAFMEKVEAAKEWGKDLIDNFVGGIKEKWENLKKAVTDIANTVKDFLGFSCPDDGPLSDADEYGPDFVDLFAEGITGNISTIKNAVSEMAGAMSGEVSATALTVGGTSGMALATAENSSSQMMLAGAGGGDICIPVYIGNEKLDELVVSATQRVNYRSGGR